MRYEDLNEDIPVFEYRFEYTDFLDHLAVEYFFETEQRQQLQRWMIKSRNLAGDWAQTESTGGAIQTISYFSRAEAKKFVDLMNILLHRHFKTDVDAEDFMFARKVSG